MVLFLFHIKMVLVQILLFSSGVSGVSHKDATLIYNVLKCSTSRNYGVMLNMSAVGSNGIPPATTVARTITDNRLKMMAVYGNAYGGGPSIQNVDVLLQGRS